MDIVIRARVRAYILRTRTTEPPRARLGNILGNKKPANIATGFQSTMAKRLLQLGSHAPHAHFRLDLDHKANDRRHDDAEA